MNFYFYLYCKHPVLYFIELKFHSVYVIAVNALMLLNSLIYVHTLQRVYLI